MTSGNYSPMLEHGIALAFLDGPGGSDADAGGHRRRRASVSGAGSAPPRVVPTPFVRAGQWASPA